MSFKILVRELKEKRDVPMRGERGGGTTESTTIVHRGGAARQNPWQYPPNLEQQQGRWANLPPELLLDVIRLMEEREVSWPARRNVLGCAAVCRLWRDITKEVVKPPGARADHLPHIPKADCATKSSNSVLHEKGQSNIYLPIIARSQPIIVALRVQNDKLLLAARKIRRSTSTDFVISSTADAFSRASNTYIGKVRSNFLGTKFTVNDSHLPSDAAVSSRCRSSNRWIKPKQVPPRMHAGNYSIAIVS